MIPLVDLHCHLLAGLDDGPATMDKAVEMCRMAFADGTRIIAAGAHQNTSWPGVTPDRIREATRELAECLRRAEVPITVFPCAEVMVHPELDVAWQKGDILSVADRRQYLLLEMPHEEMGYDALSALWSAVTGLGEVGVRPILAHPERTPVLLHRDGLMEELIQAGCLVQISSGSVTDPPSRRDERKLRDWCRRGIVHLLGSDGHSLVRRPPRIAAAYQRILDWAGASVADRVGSTNGLAISQGLSLRLPRPEPKRRRWLPLSW